MRPRRGDRGAAEPFGARVLQSVAAWLAGRTPVRPAAGTPSLLEPRVSVHRSTRERRRRGRREQRARTERVAECCCVSGQQQSHVVRAADMPRCCSGPRAWGCSAGGAGFRRGRRCARGAHEGAPRWHGRASAHLERRCGAGQQHRSPRAKHRRHSDLRERTRTASALRQGPGCGADVAHGGPREQQPRHAPDAAQRAPASACRGERVGVACRRRQAKTEARPARAPPRDACRATPVYLWVPYQGPRPARLRAAPPQLHMMSQQCADARREQMLRCAREPPGARRPPPERSSQSRADVAAAPAQRACACMLARAAHPACVAHRGRAETQPRA